MFKHEARKFYLQKRRSLTPEELDSINVKVNSHLQNLIDSKNQCVHIFLPITSKQEIDTWPFIRYLWKTGRQVVVPTIDNEHNKLVSCQLNQHTKIVEQKWGIPQPVDVHLADEHQIDTVILPLLTFDLDGHRIGYGKGFYDKFLKTLGSKVQKIGLSHFAAMDKIEDTDTWDVRLDFCITPERIIRF